jgi:predicted dehydrogenase
MADFHVRALSACPSARLTAVCSRSALTVEKRQKEWGVSSGYTDLKRMLEAGDVDAVDIVTPNSLHAPMTIAALASGKSVLCEKPPALNARQAEDMVAAASAGGKLLMFGFLFRFSEKMRLVRDLIQKGTLGEVTFVKAGIIRRRGSPGGWFTSREMAGGGPLIDVGVHMIDLAAFLIGDPQPVSVYGRTFRGIGPRDSVLNAEGGWKSSMNDSYPFDVEDGAAGFINFSNDACLSLEASNSSHIKDDAMYLEVLGTRGGITVEPVLELHTELENRLVDARLRVSCDAFDYQGSINAEMRHFVDCATGAARCESGPENGLKVMRIVDALYSSAKTGAAVTI